MSEEIRGLTWDLDGAQLAPWQAVQRLYLAGFYDAKILLEAAAVMYAESGWYLEAWHHNCRRDGDGNLVRDGDGRITVLSTDLGFIQRNVVHVTPVPIRDETDSKAFVDRLFDEHPNLADGQKSAVIAWELYKARGFGPWVAHSNRSYRRYLDVACLGVGNYLAISQGLGRDLLEMRKR